jgi:hypothetical protein|tara:strand:- start:322 stop:1077 length:756 start_codon:yes stop_codon:yes gene_type:complete
MPETTFSVSPSGTGDIGAQQTSSPIYHTLDTAQTSEPLGSVIDKYATYHAVFHRFDLSSLPKPVSIKGVLMQWTADGGGSGTFIVRGGFIDKDGKWDISGSFGNYDDVSEMPFAEWDYASQTDDTVWVEDEHAFEASVTGSGVSHDLSFGENLSLDEDTIAITGLVAQLQAYVNAEAAGPSACLLFYKPFLTGVETYQQVVTSDHVTEALRPLLTIDWEKIGAADAELEVKDLVSGASALRSVVNSKGVLR